MIQVGAQLISVTCRDEKNDFGESLGSEFELEVNSVDVWYSWRIPDVTCVKMFGTKMLTLVECVNTSKPGNSACAN